MVRMVNHVVKYLFQVNDYIFLICLLFLFYVSFLNNYIDIVLKVTRVIDEICKLRHKLLYEGKTLYDSYKTNLAMYNNLKVDV